MQDLLHPAVLVKDFSYWGIFIVLFLESGIPFGFFLPGDSLLFTAGLLASQHYLNLEGLIIISVTAAILGNNAGYFTGKWFGHRLFKNPNSLWFSPKRLEEAHHFFAKEGPLSLVIARFVPAARTFVPIAAGAAKMNYRKFFTFNTVGALLWGVGLPALGYAIGKRVPNIDKYLLPVVALIIVVSAIPAVIHWLKRRQR
jgi:membrane-associated protein